jgi:hypothetical protein
MGHAKGANEGKRCAFVDVLRYLLPARVDCRRKEFFPAGLAGDHLLLAHKSQWHIRKYIA